jgi:hypothetical protein
MLAVPPAPTFDVEAPAMMVTSAPVNPPETPAATRISPLVDDDESPVEMVTSPVAALDEPLLIAMSPEPVAEAVVDSDACVDPTIVADPP